MDQLTSPDLPVFWCYALVTLVGLFVARRNVAKSLAGMDAKWRFASTWLLFAAYLLLPVFLFWLLAWTDVVHDTSVVAAVIVGLGYQQVATTGVAGISIRGQLQIWQPFEAWSNGIAQRIIDRHVNDRVTAFDRLEVKISDNEEARAALDQLAREMAVEAGDNVAATLVQDIARIEADLKAIAPAPAAGGTGVGTGTEGSIRRLTSRRLLREVRSRAVDFEKTIVDRGVLTEEALDDAFGRTTSRTAVGLVVVAVALGGWLAWDRAPWRDSTLQREFYVWRMGLQNATPADHDRTHGFFTRVLGDTLVRDSTSTAAAGVVATRIVEQLRKRTTTTIYADRAMPIIIEARARRPSLDSYIVPALAQALRAPNADVRTRVQNTLNDVRALDYSSHAIIDATRTWAPTDQDRPTLIESHLRAWLAWWLAASAAGRDPRRNDSEENGVVTPS